MKKYKVMYREQGQMGWDKRKTMTIKAESPMSIDALKDMFNYYASQPSQYRYTLLGIYELVYEP